MYRLLVYDDVRIKLYEVRGTDRYALIRHFRATQSHWRKMNCLLFNLDNGVCWVKWSGMARFVVDEDWKLFYWAGL